MSVPVCQSFLYEWLPIVKMLQQGTYTDSPTWGEAVGPYFFKAHNQRETKYWGGKQSRPDPLAGHLPGRLSSRRTVILAHRPHGQI